MHMVSRDKSCEIYFDASFQSDFFQTEKILSLEITVINLRRSVVVNQTERTLREVNVVQLSPSAFEKFLFLTFWRGLGL